MPKQPTFLFSQLPNLLSLSRILLVPVVVVLLDERQYNLALMVFTLAGITDGLDGWIAKKYRLETAIGRILDPLADKLLLVSTYAMLTVLNDIPFWLLVMVLFRDLLILSGYWILILMDKKLPIRPIFSSKLNTFSQIVLVVVVLINSAQWLALDNIINLLIYFVALTTLYSGSRYIWMWMQQLTRETV